MVTLAWIENEIEKSLQEGNTPQNIYDLSALITVRGYLRALAEQEVEEAKPATSAPAVRISDYCADLDAAGGLGDQFRFYARTPGDRRGA